MARRARRRMRLFPLGLLFLLVSCGSASDEAEQAFLAHLAADEAGEADPARRAAAWAAWLEAWPDHPRAAEARARAADHRLFASTLELRPGREGEIEAWRLALEAYLAARPRGIHVRQARRHLADLPAAQARLAFWRHLEDGPTPLALRVAARVLAEEPTSDAAAALRSWGQRTRRLVATMPDGAPVALAAGLLPESGASGETLMQAVGTLQVREEVEVLEEREFPGWGTLPRRRVRWRVRLLHPDVDAFEATASAEDDPFPAALSLERSPDGTAHFAFHVAQAEARRLVAARLDERLDLVGAPGPDLLRTPRPGLDLVRHLSAAVRGEEGIGGRLRDLPPAPDEADRLDPLRAELATLWATPDETEGEDGGR